MNIGIIGFGRFGRLLTSYLSKDFDTYVYDKDNKNYEIKKSGGIPSNINSVCKRDILILSVPISEIECLLKKIKGIVDESSLIVDVCSVKDYTVEVMKNLLPRNTQILATHPMFGPDSAADSLKGRKIVLCKVRVKDELYKKILNYLKKKGLTIIETTPKKHDKDIAKTLLLTHFIGRSLIEFRAKDMVIDTEGYKRLMSILGVVKNDTWQLFEDMNNYNPYSKSVRKRFIKSIEMVDRRL